MTLFSLAYDVILTNSWLFFPTNCTTFFSREIVFFFLLLTLWLFLSLNEQLHSHKRRTFSSQRYDFIHINIGPNSWEKNTCDLIPLKIQLWLRSAYEFSCNFTYVFSHRFATFHIVKTFFLISLRSRCYNITTFLEVFWLLSVFISYRCNFFFLSTYDFFS